MCAGLAFPASPPDRAVVAFQNNYSAMVRCETRALRRIPRASVMQRPSASSAHVPWYPKDLLHELQTTLAAVADIDVRYDSEREQIAAHLGSEAVKSQLTSELEDHRRAEREPYVQRLAELHYQMMAAMAYRDIGESA